MNWLLTLIFYFYLFIQYYLFGTFCVSFSNYRSTLSSKLIFGFFSTYFLLFLVGFPCQILGTSWIIYFILATSTLLLVDIIIFLYLKTNHRFEIGNLKLKKDKLIDILKCNWVCILFILMFSFYSISNNLPLYQQNYDDYYYIGKIVNLIGTNQLLNEDYYNGALVANNTPDITRVINTFELSYGYFLTVFHIKATFFCRITMMMHNYFFFTLIYRSLAELFLKNKYLSQYAIVPFFLFLIPLGYLQNGFPIESLRIASYDLWQFQTASFYGGSVVRMLSLPTLALFSFPLIKKIELKKVILLGMLCLSFLSFSTIFVQIFILFLVAILISKFTFMVFVSIREKNKKFTLLYSICLITIIILLFLTRLLDHIPVINNVSFRECIEGFQPYISVWYQNDFLIKYGFVPCIILLFIVKNAHLRSFFLSFVVLYLMFRTMYFLELYAVSSFNFFFVINRTIASVQYIVMLNIGIVIALIYKKLFHNRWLVSLLTFVFSLSLLYFFQTHIDYFIDFSYLGSGISKAGWNFSRILDFDNTMSLEIFSDIGSYFNNLDYGNYRLYAPQSFIYNGNETFSAGLITESNRIQIHIGGGFEELTSDDNAILNDFALGTESDVSVVLDALNRCDIDYILLFDENNTQLLLQNQGTLVFDSKDSTNKYYLVKL